jgi:hypothetical protein
VQPDDPYSPGRGRPAEVPGPPAPRPPLSGYEGPPPTTPPPYGWQPERIVEPAPPRRLPAQDHTAIDAAEARARTLTYGVGVVVGAILLIVLCGLCGRALF